MHLLLLFLPFFRVAGSYEITGPNAVRGLVGGSLTVECCYASTWKTYSKWWCRGSIWRRCNILVQTTGSEQKVKKNKVSIRDNQKNFTFSVTMEELTETDTDIYWCGIEKSGTDLGVEVKVTIDPAPTTVSTTTTTTTTSKANMSTAPAETKDPPTVTSSHSNDRDNAMTLSVLIPTILAVLLLLLVAASLLTLRIMKQQKKAAEMSPEQVLQPQEGDLCYANLTLQPTQISRNSSKKKACAKPSLSVLDDQLEVEYVTMAPLSKEDISYAALSWELSNQEPTYCNMGHPDTHVPSRSQQEHMEYSTIKRP
ncbi:CMRF35-like molecule 1 isoform X3 [Canis lupus familiaris]|uniref:CD300 molecule like family member f n=1 Tax=Canis lupus familiaris TaxID=9615 RepID=A0A8C0RXL5_CANLF|nr:CMRF35-like molecule 1 isoform X3 [Canis lupus familiaris]|eukprot:XP_540416.3 CMRF35-like molecule 1 [Canis lupus familiaris]